ncbi:MAG TPA: methyltransferase domain-containing protein [Gaiellaceae bacterium]|nr:methyltransferase domain-containing protein [Gaiellaceae bacterium]
MVEDVVTFVLANLPPAPARVLEVGAGNGELSRRIAAAGHSVVAIDPAADASDVLPVRLDELDEPATPFDAAVAVVSLHHIEPLDDSCARLAEVLGPQAVLLVDELDVERFDERAAVWWLAQRNALGFDETSSPAEVIARRRSEVHPVPKIVAALEPHFELRTDWRGPFLYRFGLGEDLRPAEEELIVAGDLPAIGMRLVGRLR